MARLAWLALHHRDLSGPRNGRYKGMMRFHGLIAGWVLLWAACVPWAGSQAVESSVHRIARPATHAKVSGGPQLLGKDDGLAILGAALESRHKVERRSDCSHLVHAIYEKAGYPYKYEPSTDLYVGVDAFHRVMEPQPGDLIVWPGHAGIVVNPAQHTFYSALRSGFGVEPYNSVYWKGRGRPHFFRYVKVAFAPVVAAASRTASLKPVGGHPSSIELIPASAIGELAEVSADAHAEATESVPMSPPIPAPVSVKSARPKINEVNAALTDQFRTTAEALQARDMLTVSPPLVVFDRIEVKKVQLKGDKGWAEVSVRSAVSLVDSNAKSKNIADVQRWTMRRVSTNGWEIVPPTNAVYVPREAAVRLLAHQLAALTDANSQATIEQKAQLAHWLDTLLD